MTTLQGAKAPSRARKEAFFVRVADTEGAVAFFNATSHIGKEMPFTKPLATCAMRVTPDAVGFSLLHIPARKAADFTGKAIEIPRGPLARLERKAAGLIELGDKELVVELEEATYSLAMALDDNGIATLEMTACESNPEAGEISFELPRGAVKLSVYLRSPAVKRTIGIGFIGHLGKPEGSETVARATAMVLNSLSQLVEFRVLSGIETVTVPAAPSRWSGSRKVHVRRAEEKATISVPVWLFSTELELAAAGQVGVEVDLENANPTSGRILCHYSPSEEVAPVFDAYRTSFDGAISQVLRTTLGDEEMASITYDIVLGDVSAGTIERLREALAGVAAGLDMTPAQFRAHDQSTLA